MAGKNVSNSTKAKSGKLQPQAESKRTSPVGWAILVTESIILISLLVGIVVQKNWYASYKSPEVTEAKAIGSPIKTATTSASPTPAAMLKQTPIKVTSWGKSVNVPILMYHYIGNNPNPSDKARYILETTPDLLDQEMNYLSKSDYTPITLDTLYAALKGNATLPAKPIVLTFDDGYVDFFVNAFPILEKYHFHAVSFIPTSLMNQGYYMTWDEIKQIQQSGLVSFEAHSLTHPNLATIPLDKAEQEIFDSKKILESETGAPVNFFAYPYGVSDPLVREYVKEAGYFAAVGTWYGRTEAEGDIYNWPRVRINGQINLAQFERQVSP